MRIVAKQAGMQFFRETVFRDFTQTFETGIPCAVTGPNGSGKSTLLRILAGHLLPTEGEVEYYGNHNGKIDPEIFYREIAVCAPYLELPEELTLSEIVRFHHALKPLTLSGDEFIAKLGFERYRNKPIIYFSSGMKQKLKLGLTIYSNVPIFFLDEPGNNLDKANFEWYKNEVKEYLDYKLIIIFSNMPEEYDFCKKIINISDYK